MNLELLDKLIPARKIWQQHPCEPSRRLMQLHKDLFDLRRELATIDPTRPPEVLADLEKQLRLYEAALENENYGEELEC